MSDENYNPVPRERVCGRCLKVVPNTDFPPDSDMCNKCCERLTAEDATQRYEELRQLLCGKAVHRMIAERRGTKIDAPHISEYVATLVQQLGGLQQMAETHARQIEIAIEDEPGSRKVLDHFKTLANLITASTEHRQSAPDVEGLTDEEIIAEFQVLTMQSLAADKDTFNEVLRLAHEEESDADS